jgi:hypothetical protein
MDFLSHKSDHFIIERFGGTYKTESKIAARFEEMTHTVKNQTENSKQIFPELSGHSSNFHIHVTVSDL